MAELIGDVGGSSSRWAVIDGGRGPEVISGLPGYNPATGAADAFIAALRGRFSAAPPASVTVYGAGCGSDERKAIMIRTLREVFPFSVPLVVETDLLGAARGLCGEEAALVLILGTGMNAGRYDGAVLHQPMPSLGFVLGDEGSGADLGKVLVREALRGSLPAPVMEHVFPGGLSVEVAIDRIYRAASPQAWLASFAGRLVDVLDQPWARQAALERFVLLAALLARYFPPSRNAVVHATGGIAWGYRTLLSEALARQGYRLTSVERDPMRGLVHWHRAPR